MTDRICRTCLNWSEMIARKLPGETEVSALCLSTIGHLRQTYTQATCTCLAHVPAGILGASDDPKRRWEP